MLAVGSSGGLGPPCPFVLCNEFSYGRDQLTGDFHDCLSRILICRLILGNGLFFRLLFVVLEYSLHFFSSQPGGNLLWFISFLSYVSVFDMRTMASHVIRTR